MLYISYPDQYNVRNIHRNTYIIAPQRNYMTVCYWLPLFVLNVSCISEVKYTLYDITHGWEPTNLFLSPLTTHRDMDTFGENMVIFLN